MEEVNRRSLLKVIGSAAVIPELSEPVLGFSSARNSAVVEAAGPGSDPDAKPKDSIEFAVIGLDHYHIMGMTAAVQRGGGQLESVYSTNPQAIADFQKRFGDVKVAKSKGRALTGASLAPETAGPLASEAACGNRPNKESSSIGPLPRRPGGAAGNPLPPDSRTAQRSENRRHLTLLAE